MAQDRAQQLEEFIASKGLNADDTQDILDYKDLLVQKGIYAARHFHRVTAKALEGPPGEPLPADRVQLLIDMFNPAASIQPGRKREGEELEAEPPAKRKGPQFSKEKEWQISGACQPEVHYMVETGASKVEEMIKKGRYAIVIDHRQSGKTTLAVAAERRQPNTMHISLSSFNKTGTSIWSFLSKKFRVKSHMEPGSEKDSIDFESLLHSRRERINLILDEADKLEQLSDDELAHFLLTFRTLKESVVGGFVLLGTYKLPAIVSTERWPPDQENSLWDAQATVISPCKLRKESVRQALDDWEQDNPGCKLLPNTGTFAQDIESRCGGNAGISGMCLHTITEEARNTDGVYQASDWGRMCALDMPMKLRQTDVYKQVFKRRVDELSADEKDLLLKILLQGEVQQGELELGPAAKSLCNLGLCSIFEDPDTKLETLRMSSPLLATSIMLDIEMEIPEDVQPPPAEAANNTSVFAHYLLETSIAYADIDILQRVEQQLRKKVKGAVQTSEYAFQAELAMKASAIAKKFASSLGRYKVRRECFVETGRRGPRPRLDILITNGQSTVPLRLGQELLVAGDAAALTDHFKRAAEYAAAHQCCVFVVNLTVAAQTAQTTTQVDMPADTDQVKGVNIVCNPETGYAQINYGCGEKKSIELKRLPHQIPLTWTSPNKAQR